jgi:hypothetical protein
MEHTAIKTASKLLQNIYHDDNDDMAYEATVVIKEAENDTDFFLSQLDQVIVICNTLKGAIIKESNNEKISITSSRTRC